MTAKAELRKLAYAVRKAQLNKSATSRAAIDRLLAIPEYQSATTVMWYVDCRSELHTQQALPAVLATDQRVVVPYCTVDEHGNNELGLFHLKCLDELAIGKWRILEPRLELRQVSDRIVSVEQLDLVIVPGVAFSPNGHRLGNGQGYYDRLLSRLGPQCTTVGICFECQLMPRIPTETHDQSLDIIVTEKRVIVSE